MKKLFLIIFVLYGVANAQTGTQRPAFNRGPRYTQIYSQAVTWHKTVDAGTDSNYVRGETDGWIRGASDILYSDIFFNHGRNNVTFDFVADASPSNFSVQVKVQTANSGNYAALDIPETWFTTAYWLKKGTGVAGNIVSTTQDSITTAGKTGTIQIPLLDCEWYKFLIISSSVHADTNKVNAHLTRQER